MSRRDSRIAAFTLLFESDFHPELKYSEIYEQAEEVRELTMDSFAKKLYETATENIAEINKIIEGTSKNWKINRMSAVSRSIVRLAVAEITYTEVPPKVAINEAVEIAKLYDDERAPGFINGILNTVARDLGKIASDEQ